MNARKKALQEEARKWQRDQGLNAYDCSIWQLAEFVMHCYPDESQSSETIERKQHDEHSKIQG